MSADDVHRVLKLELRNFRKFLDVKVTEKRKERAKEGLASEMKERERERERER